MFCFTRVRMTPAGVMNTCGAFSGETLALHFPRRQRDGGSGQGRASPGRYWVWGGKGLTVALSSSAGVLMVYFSGYLIEATGSWATMFALVTAVNLLGLCAFMAFAEARRVDIDASKDRRPNIHI